ncbi:MAG: restriction endonuclease subunit S, partial [Thermoguttaceae bacterium]|nr:restriction endonuclease subunit S [Thermoguttaceae bacterium]
MARLMKDSGIPWIGEIPLTWNTNTVFQIFTQVKNKNDGLREKNLLSLSYGKSKRKNIDTTDGLLPESFDGYNVIENGDIVLRLTDLQNDQKSLRVGLAPERGIITSAYLTIRNRSNSLSEYLYYYLHAFDISKGFYGMGAGVRQGLNWDGIKWLQILTPSVSEQKQIANFLDAECARIDAIIEQTRATVEEYKKLKQSIITQAVTKGIRPNRPMKDSGIEWIGEIPEDWEVKRGKNVLNILERPVLNTDGV